MLVDLQDAMQKEIARGSDGRSSRRNQLPHYEQMQG
jgi:hypothetical protein